MAQFSCLVGHTPGYWQAASTDQALLASFECFYRKYRWQVARDFLPIFTFIQAREYRTTVRAEIDARRITLVTSHCLT